MGSESKTVKDIIPDKAESVETELDKQKIIEAIRSALGTLTAREEKIMRLRFGITESEDNYEEYGITMAEYRKIASKAKGKS